MSITQSKALIDARLYLNGRKMYYMHEMPFLPMSAQPTPQELEFYEECVDKETEMMRELKKEFVKME